MLRTSLIRLAKNSPWSINMAEDAKVGSKMSSITRSTKNFLLDIAKDVEIGGNWDGVDDKTIKWSPFCKKPNVLREYLTSLCSTKRWVSSNSFWAIVEALSARYY